MENVDIINTIKKYNKNNYTVKSIDNGYNIYIYKNGSETEYFKLSKKDNVYKENLPIKSLNYQYTTTFVDYKKSFNYLIQMFKYYQYEL